MYIPVLDALVLHERMAPGHLVQWEPYLDPPAPQGGWWITSGPRPVLLTLDRLLIDPLTLQLGWTDGRDDPVTIFAEPGKAMLAPVDDGTWSPISRCVVYLGQPLVRCSWVQAGEAGLCAMRDLTDQIKRHKQSDIAVPMARLGLLCRYDPNVSLTLQYPCFEFENVIALPDNLSAEPVKVSPPSPQPVQKVVQKVQKVQAEFALPEVDPDAVAIERAREIRQRARATQVA